MPCGWGGGGQPLGSVLVILQFGLSCDPNPLVTHGCLWWVIGDHCNHWVTPGGGQRPPPPPRRLVQMMRRISMRHAHLQQDAQCWVVGNSSNAAHTLDSCGIWRGGFNANVSTSHPRSCLRFLHVASTLCSFFRKFGSCRILSCGMLGLKKINKWKQMVADSVVDIFAPLHYCNKVFI